jgi:hypothetical protein
VAGRCEGGYKISSYVKVKKMFCSDEELRVIFSRFISV